MEKLIDTRRMVIDPENNGAHPIDHSLRSIANKSTMRKNLWEFMLSHHRFSVSGAVKIDMPVSAPTLVVAHEQKAR